MNRLAQRALALVASGAFALSALGLGAEAAPPPDLKEGFRAEPGLYVSSASGTGSSAQEAEGKARSAALHGLFAGLGKDGLFAEVFAASPPLGLSFVLADSSKSGGSFRALVVLKVDEESLRIIERGPYLAAALSLLDKAETASNEAEARRSDGAAAESKADLGSALGLYGMAADSSRAALALVDPVSDPSIFSSQGKRTAPELKKGLAATLAEAQAGIERVKQAEAALAADASSQAALDVADTVVKAADAAQALLDENASLLGDLGAYDADRLSPLRDRLDLQRRSLSDAKLALDRAKAAVLDPSFAADKLEFAKRRLATADASLAAAYRNVDREIRDPAVRRAARARTLRWALLHEPREYLSLRSYLPFGVAAGEGSSAEPLQLIAGLEGAFGFGHGGVWLRSRARFSGLDLEPGVDGGEQSVVTQSFDFGVWGKSLVFAGYAWDWRRAVDDASYRSNGLVEAGFGGVYGHGQGEERFQRADWIISLNYQLPGDMDGFKLWNVLNPGLETQLRLGRLGILEASASNRLERIGEDEYVSVLSWAVGLGLRLPAPFAFGAEYGGSYIRPFDAEDDKLGEALDRGTGRFRFFVQYSI